MGPETEKDFSQFGLADAEVNDFNTVLGRFNDYSEPKRNFIHERATFHKRNQKEGESVEEYIRHLYELSEHANFADRECTIRDRLVLGLLNQELWKTTVRKWADPYQGSPARQTKWAGEATDKGRKGSGTFLSWCSEGRG